MLEERAAFASMLRAERPLYAAPDRLRQRIRNLLETERSDSELVQRQQYAPVEKASRSWLSYIWPQNRPVLAGVAILTAFIVVGLILVYLRTDRATAFVDLAAKTHQQYISGKLPLEVKTASPASVVSWFSNKVRFAIRLPDYEEGLEQRANYTLVGGRLVEFRGHYGAYLVYRMAGRDVSLVVIPAKDAVALGGVETIAKSLTFHSHRRNSLQVVTWSAHETTYAVVSNIDAPARESCRVCHLAANDGHFIHLLKGNFEYSAESGPETFLLSYLGAIPLQRP